MNITHLLILDDVPESDEVSVVHVLPQLLLLLLGLLNLVLVLIAAVCDARYAILVVFEADTVRMSGVPMRLIGDLFGGGAWMLADLHGPRNLRHV